VAEQLFLFVQMEFPLELGPSDGRYLVRAKADAKPEHVVVFSTLSAPPRAPSRLRRAQRPTSPDPAPVPTTRVTIIDPVPLQTESQARRWLSELGERESTAAAAVLNRVLFAHRIAGADPYVRELSATQALIVRAGWGEGEEVADGRFSHARELVIQERRAHRRTHALRPQERLAVLLSTRGKALMCEELTLRARQDLDQGRHALAALELERAYATALPELRGEQRADLEPRISELEQLRPGVQREADLALLDADPGEQTLRHALERVEAALRARTATGFSLQ
jgi:hypothetical protein